MNFKISLLKFSFFFALWAILDVARASRASRMPLYFGKRNSHSVAQSAVESSGLPSNLASLSEALRPLWGHELYSPQKRSPKTMDWNKAIPILLTGALPNLPRKTREPRNVVRRMPVFYGKRSGMLHTSMNNGIFGYGKRGSGSVLRMPAFWGRKRSGPLDVETRRQISSELIELLPILEGGGASEPYGYENTEHDRENDDGSTENDLREETVTEGRPTTPSDTTKRNSPHIPDLSSLAASVSGHDQAPSSITPETVSVKRHAAVYRMPNFYGKRSRANTVRNETPNLSDNLEQSLETLPQTLLSLKQGLAPELLLNADRENLLSAIRLYNSALELAEKRLVESAAEELSGLPGEDSEGEDRYEQDLYPDLLKQILFSKNVSPNDMYSYLR